MASMRLTPWEEERLLIFSAAELARRLPTRADYDYVLSVMKPVREPGKFANWIAPPHQGINNQPIECEYVQFH